MEPYLEIVERLRIITINRATGKTGDFIPYLPPAEETRIRKLTSQDNEEYIQLRQKLLTDMKLEYGVPIFIKVCHTMPEFWSYIKSRYKSYEERRKFLNSEYNQAIAEFEHRRKNVDNGFLVPIFQDSTPLEGNEDDGPGPNFFALKKDLEVLDHWLNSFTNLKDSNRLASFWNIVIYGRMVTFHLHKLMSENQEFEIWYEPYKEFMKNDELMRFFKDIRNKIEKEGLIFPRGTSTHIRNLSLPEDLAKFGPAPPGALSFFIGDQSGGSGWIVKGPDGKGYKQYVDLPLEIGDSGLVLKEMPESHKGSTIQHPTLEKISKMYVTYLSNLISDARSRFGSG